jgi:adenylate cyclase
MIALGPARLDTEKQELSVGALTFVLQRKPYLVFLYLIENRHRMVGRKELLDRFWEGKEVYDQSLSKAIGAIRRALGEFGPELIETRWGLGYRYIGPFSESSAELRNEENGLVSPLPSRADRADISPASSPGDANASMSGETISESTPHRTSFWLRTSFPFVVLVALLAIAIFAFRRQSATRAAQIQVVSSQPRSIAVLPFTGSSSDSDDQYLGPELADAVTARLMTVPQFDVRSSTTVNSVLGRHGDSSRAGSKLAVQDVVEGEIRHENGTVILNVLLRDGATGTVLWSGTFDTSQSNIFATEDSIARQVAWVLLPQLGANAIKRSLAQETKRPEAYTNYMKAKFFAITRTRASLAKAISLLRDAIGIDPNYAPAYATLADCLQLQGFYGFISPSDAYPPAEAAAQKALSLDAGNAEAHVALMSALSDYDWDWKGAEREFKAAIAVDPNHAVAYQYYGYALFAMNRGNEALAAMKQAAQIDPVSPSIQTSLAWGFYLLRQYDQAVAQCNRVLELYPEFVPAHQLLGIIYGQMELNQKSMAELTWAERLEKDDDITPVLIDLELARSGQRSEAARNLAQIHAELRGAAVPDYYVAAAWAAVGDRQKAQSYLDRAFRSHSNWVIYLRCDPRFDSLRRDPAFQALLEKVDESHGESHPG